MKANEQPRRKAKKELIWGTRTQLPWSSLNLEIHPLKETEFRVVRLIEEHLSPDLVTRSPVKSGNMASSAH